MSIFDNYFDPLASSFATAQIPSSPGAFPNPPASAPSPAPLAIPPAEQPSFPPPQATGAAPPPQPPGAWDSTNNGLSNHALTLMGLGAGIAQGGVGKGLALAGIAAEAERRLLAQQVNALANPVEPDDPAPEQGRDVEPRAVFDDCGHAVSIRAGDRSTGSVRDSRDDTLVKAT